MSSRTGYAVLGLGLFGASIARTLAAMGHRVLAIDNQPAHVEAIASVVAEAVHADATDRGALEALHIDRYSAVFVTIGDLAASILCTLALRELGVRRIIGKINSVQQGRILARLGAEDILFPERDMGERIARQVASASFVTMQIDLARDASLLEMVAPPVLAGRTLAQADVRRRFDVTIVAIRRRESNDDVVEEAIVSPPADTRVREHDLVLVAGRNESLQRFRQATE